MQHEELIDFDTLKKDYQEIETFIKKHSLITNIEFDYYVNRELNLFKNCDNFDFEKLDENLNFIISNLGAIKRIFANPIIRLKDNMEILPIDLIKNINSQTLMHASNHSELFTDIKDDNFKPTKLLSYTNSDDYAIYENVAFIFCINQIRKYVKRNLTIIRNILYANNLIKLNISERIDHQLYYLALGKLQTSYVKNLDKHFDIAFSCLNKLNYIKNIIDSRLVNPIYKKVKIDNLNFKLKQTNIFKHHKDYKRVYHLLKFFDDNKISNLNIKQDILSLKNNYFNFIEIMFIFSILHFNFKLEDNTNIDFNDLNLIFQYKKWQLTLKKSSYKNEEVLLLKMKAEKEYKILIAPLVIKDEEDDLSYKDYRADEKFFPSMHGYDETTYISINDLHSFLRIQQLLHKAMIYVDNKKDICPFCGNKLNQVYINNKIHYICYSCRNDIVQMNCKIAHRSFYATRIFEYESQNNNEELLYKENNESLMHFRNITKINHELNIICPYCKKIHY